MSSNSGLINNPQPLTNEADTRQVYQYMLVFRHEQVLSLTVRLGFLSHYWH